MIFKNTFLPDHFTTFLACVIRNLYQVTALVAQVIWAVTFCQAVITSVHIICMSWTLLDRTFESFFVTLPVVTGLFTAIACPAGYRTEITWVTGCSTLLEITAGFVITWMTVSTGRSTWMGVTWVTGQCVFIEVTGRSAQTKVTLVTWWSVLIEVTGLKRVEHLVH